jgi:hypothetical protein
VLAMAGAGMSDAEKIAVAPPPQVSIHTIRGVLAPIRGKASVTGSRRQASS